jgi:hypothetical protein
MPGKSRRRAPQVTLPALWDGAGAVKRGGTAAFAEQVRATGEAVIQIDTGELRTC